MSKRVNFIDLYWKCSNVECELNNGWHDWNDASFKEIKHTVMYLIKSGKYKEQMDKQIPIQYL
jgi:hypothetical protein